MLIFRNLLAFVSGVLGLILLVPLVLFIVPVWLVSVATRAGARLLSVNHLTIDQLVEYDGVFGWKARPNLNIYHLNGDIFKLSTGSDGWRGGTRLEDSDLVVFGDSFAAGYGVGDKDFFAHIYRSPQIKAIGIGGYSLVQELLWMRQLAPLLKNKQVVWFVYYGNDLYDNLTPDMRGYRKPFVRERKGEGTWEIVSHHITSEMWPLLTPSRANGMYYYPRLADLCSQTFLSLRAYAACEYLIREGRLVCEEAGCELLVLGVPDPHQLSVEGHGYLRSQGGDVTFDAGYPDRQLSRICDQLGIEFIPGSSFLQPCHYLSNDCHWNERGHRRMADALREIYTRKKSERITQLRCDGQSVPVQA